MNQKDRVPIFIPTVARQVYDVSGAGDTVIATLTLAVASGFDFPDAARLANLAAGIVVGKVGTQPVNILELQASLATSDGGIHSQIMHKMTSFHAPPFKSRLGRRMGNR